MESKEKALIVISQKYPYGSGEIYMERELNSFAENYSHILLLPIAFTGKPRIVNDKTEISHFFENRLTSGGKKVVLTNFRLIFSILWLEFWKTKAKTYFLRNLKQWVSQLGIAITDGERFKDLLGEKDISNPDYYSVWMDEGALMLSILKRKGYLKQFSFRLHGYDLYDERRDGNYMPFRYFCFQQATKIFIVSKMGKTYLENKKLFPEKLIVNYSGLFDNGLNPKTKQDDTFVICSCSNVIPLKRVTKIAEALEEIPFKTKWIHIGDGSEMEQLKTAVEKLPGHITVDLKGRLPNESVVEIYNNVPIDIFVHVSETEGLPLSLVEAMSAGIPCVATDAGGTCEIIEDSNGVLLPVDFEISQLRNKITKFKTDNAYWLAMKKGARAQFLEKFNAEDNYPQFTKMLMS